MTLSALKEILEQLKEIRFLLPNGDAVPNHFHVTEVGSVNKHFIDCGGTIRKDSVISFQLFTATDYDHRLSVEKLKSILTLSETKLGLGDDEIEVEYQSNTIGKYGLGFDGKNLLLTVKQTDCLAKDNCGIPQEKPRVRLSSTGTSNACEPGSGCC